MGNDTLTNAKKAKNDEFYTQYPDIEKEINAYLEYNPNVFKNKTILLPCDDPEWSNFTRYFAQNFQRLGLKKIIGTSYAEASKPYKTGRETPDWEKRDKRYTPKKSFEHGKIFIVSKDNTGNGKVDFEDLEWDYLKGDGDFRSEEVTKLRDESDIIVTNPPFSLFREFLAWINPSEKNFLIIGNMNAITYKETFPLIKENKMWLGATGFNEGMYFYVPDSFKYSDTYKFEKESGGKKVNRVPGICWFTNLEHGRRHQPLSLMTEADVIKFGSKTPFQKYDNYDAIEVPKTKWIPSDYKGVMGVPISFLDKYCPEQFEIVKFRHGNDNKDLRLSSGDCPYFRILIRHKTL